MSAVTMETTFQRNGSFEKLFKSLQKEDRAWLASEVYAARTSGGYVEYPEERVSPLGTCIALVNMAMDNDMNDQVDEIIIDVTNIDQIEDEFDIDIIENIPRKNCFCCGIGQEGGTGEILTREFPWKSKYKREEDEGTNLEVDMCEGHYDQILIDNDGQVPSTFGHDWYDAVEGIIG